MPVVGRLICGVELYYKAECLEGLFKQNVHKKFSIQKIVYTLWLSEFTILTYLPELFIGNFRDDVTGKSKGRE